MIVFPTICWTQLIGGGTAIIGAEVNRSGGGICIAIFGPFKWFGWTSNASWFSASLFSSDFTSLGSGLAFSSFGCSESFSLTGTWFFGDSTKFGGGWNCSCCKGIWPGWLVDWKMMFCWVACTGWMVCVCIVDAWSDCIGGGWMIFGGGTAVIQEYLKIDFSLVQFLLIEIKMLKNHFNSAKLDKKVIGDFFNRSLLGVKRTSGTLTPSMWTLLDTYAVFPWTMYCCEGGRTCCCVVNELIGCACCTIPCGW